MCGILLLTAICSLLTIVQKQKGYSMSSLFASVHLYGLNLRVGFLRDLNAF